MAPRETRQLSARESRPEAALVTAPVNDELRSDKQAAFVREYCLDWNAAQAAVRAGYSEKTAASIGYENLRKPEIKAAIERRLAAISAIAEVDAALVMRELLDVATSDPRELVAVHLDACRWCHGLQHRRQWTRW